MTHRCQLWLKYLTENLYPEGFVFIVTWPRELKSTPVKYDIYNTHSTYIGQKISAIMLTADLWMKCHMDLEDVWVTNRGLK